MASQALSAWLARLGMATRISFYPGYPDGMLCCRGAPITFVEDGDKNQYDWIDLTSEEKQTVIDHAFEIATAQKDQCKILVDMGDAKMFEDRNCYSA